ncbi:MAG: Na+/H+ antiporter NhaC family protein [Bacteroidales bacterium]|nr:Na+/H+ antiporter NhaC family protein [Bacteroidales bacterium]
MNKYKQLQGWIALSPLFLFLILYLGLSVLINDFYKIPITTAFLLSSCYAILITKGVNIEKRIAIFSKGASHPNILLMIWIFILAGAFAEGAKAMGSIDATVNCTLYLLPDNLIFAGIFIAACFVSLSIGTSVGTIVALTPVAVGIAQKSGMDVAYITAIVVGGAFFGDNLSFISDTTIAATKTQGCVMRDKFKVNSLIAFPAAIVALIIYIFNGTSIHNSLQLESIEWVKIVPYLIVLIAALSGIHVIIVLILGILSSGVIGMISMEFTFFDWLNAMGKGIVGMSELIIVTLLAGGLLELIKFNGGIDFIIQKLTSKINSKRGAELSIATLVSITNICTANNTIAIITVGSIAKEIATKFHLDRRKVASLLDTFSCFIQGILPYGAQLLMAAGLANLSPIAIIGNLYYPFILGLFSLLSILIRYPKKYS